MTTAAAQTQPIEESDERAAPNRASIASINHRMPPFPCVVIAFSKVPGNNVFVLHTFDNQREFDTFRTMTVGAVRVVLQQSDLADVPTPTLLAVFNSTRADNPLDRFRDRKTAETRVFEVMKDLATPYKESTMAEATTEPQNRTEAKAAEKAAAKAAKKEAADKEKAAKKAESDAKRADGVIGTIFKMISSDTGATQSEILDALVAKFPDRTRDGMSSTVKIQSSRLAKTKNREIVSANIEGRGRVYKFKDMGPIPGKVVVEAPAAETPAEPKTGAEPSGESTGETPVNVGDLKVSDGGATTKAVAKKAGAKRAGAK